MCIRDRNNGARFAARSIVKHHIVASATRYTILSALGFILNLKKRLRHHLTWHVISRFDRKGISAPITLVDLHQNTAGSTGGAATTDAYGRTQVLYFLVLLVLVLVLVPCFFCPHRLFCLFLPLSSFLSFSALFALCPCLLPSLHLVLPSLPLCLSYRPGPPASRPSRPFVSFGDVCVTV